VLDGSERFAASQANVAHVAYVEDANTGAHRHMLGNDAGILDRHIPAVELDHLRAQSAMNAVERSFANRGSGVYRGQKASGYRQ